MPAIILRCWVKFACGFLSTASTNVFFGKIWTNYVFNDDVDKLRFQCRADRHLSPMCLWTKYFLQILIFQIIQNFSLFCGTAYIRQRYHLVPSITHFIKKSSFLILSVWTTQSVIRLSINIIIRIQENWNMILEFNYFSECQRNSFCSNLNHSFMNLYVPHQLTFMTSVFSWNQK